MDVEWASTTGPLVLVFAPGNIVQDLFLSLGRDWALPLSILGLALAGLSHLLYLRTRSWLTPQEQPPLETDQYPRRPPQSAMSPGGHSDEDQRSSLDYARAAFHTLIENRDRHRDLSNDIYPTLDAFTPSLAHVLQGQRTHLLRQVDSIRNESLRDTVSTLLSDPTTARRSQERTQREKSGNATYLGMRTAMEQACWLIAYSWYIGALRDLADFVGWRQAERKRIIRLEQALDKATKDLARLVDKYADLPLQDVRERIKNRDVLEKRLLLHILKEIHDLNSDMSGV